MAPRLALTAPPLQATEYAVDAVSADKIIDTNGAGDAFVGGFLSQLVQGKPVEVRWLAVSLFVMGGWWLLAWRCHTWY